VSIGVRTLKQRVSTLASIWKQHKIITELQSQELPRVFLLKLQEARTQPVSATHRLNLRTYVVIINVRLYTSLTLSATMLLAILFVYIGLVFHSSSQSHLPTANNNKLNLNLSFLEKFKLTFLTHSCSFQLCSFLWSNSDRHMVDKEIWKPDLWKHTKYHIQGGRQVRGIEHRCRTRI
jgi:hypothetical protein